MKYIISIVGKTNVGKSVLFNRLTKTNKSLVANIENTTRDRNYGECKINNNNFIIIDTGGFDPYAKKGIIYKIAKQTKQAIIESDITIFLIDGRCEISLNDKIIADFLNKYNITYILAINKIEHIKHHYNINNFYELNYKNFIIISALHGYGVNDLIKKSISIIDNKLKKKKKNINIISKKKNSNTIIFSIVGQPNVGKSTLLNLLFKKKRVITHSIPGTTRDSIEIELKYINKKYIIIDTAGIRKKKNIFDFIEKNSIVRTLKSIHKSNVVLLLIDAKNGICIQDINIANFILNSGKSLVIGINKCDLLSINCKNKIKNELKKKLSFLYFIKIYFISSLKSLGIKSLMNGIYKTYNSTMINFKSLNLNKTLIKAINHQKPQKVGIIRPKLKYAHQGGKNPPIIVIHGNSLNILNKNYKRYLTKYFIKKFLIFGTPLKIKFKNNKNPFIFKK